MESSSDAMRRMLGVCEDMIKRRKSELEEYADRSCYNAAWCEGALATAKDIEATLRAELNNPALSGAILSASEEGGVE